jgi:hypothetical protein
MVAQGDMVAQGIWWLKEYGGSRECGGLGRCSLGRCGFSSLRFSWVGSYGWGGGGGGGLY